MNSVISAIQIVLTVTKRVVGVRIGGNFTFADLDSLQTCPNSLFHIKFIWYFFIIKTCTILPWYILWYIHWYISAIQLKVPNLGGNYNSLKTYELQLEMTNSLFVVKTYCIYFCNILVVLNSWFIVLTKFKNYIKMEINWRFWTV